MAKGKAWTKEEEQLLIDNYKKIPMTELGMLLNRSSDALRIKAGKLGISGSLCQWTKEQDQYLIKNYLTLSAEQIANELNKTATTVYRRHKKLGLERVKIEKEKPVKEKPVKVINPCYWTKEEDELLVKHYSTATNEEIVKYIKRSPHAIKVRANKMGLKKFCQQKSPWTKEEDEYIIKNHLMSAIDLCIGLDRTYGSVLKRRQTLGFSKPRINKEVEPVKKPSPGYMVKATYSLKEDVNNPYIAIPTKYKRTMRYPTEETVESARNRALDSMTNHMKVVNIEIKEVVPL